MTTTGDGDVGEAEAVGSSASHRVLDDLCCASGGGEVGSDVDAEDGDGDCGGDWTFGYGLRDRFFATPVHRFAVPRAAHAIAYSWNTSGRSSGRTLREAEMIRITRSENTGDSGIE